MKHNFFSYIILSFLIQFSLSTFAGPIPGVPNDLRRNFKSLHKFQEQTIDFNHNKILARKNPISGEMSLFYKIPPQIKNQIFKSLIQNRIPKSFSLKLSQINTETPSEFYSLYYKNKIVEGAWVEIQRAEDKSYAIGVQLPSSYDILKFDFKNPISGIELVYINNKIVEQLKIIDKDRSRIIFPTGANLPERIVLTSTIKKDSGSFERFTLPKGSFPDQIVTDSEGKVWFTQPFDNLVTSYHPETKIWEHISVGKGPDGLFITPGDTLWFGEYDNKSLGSFDIRTKKYASFSVPYTPSTPAIPYVDVNGKIWLSDHEANKVSVLNKEDDSWKVISPPQSGSWIVQLIQIDENQEDLFATHCYSNAIGKVSTSTLDYSEIPLGVSSCPAFFTTFEHFLYISLWTGQSLIKLNTKTNEIIEIPLNTDNFKESGVGPITKDKLGYIYFASLQKGRLYKLDPKTDEISYIDGIRNTKDGIAVDKQQNVWVTETSGTLIKAKFSEEMK